MKTGSWHQVLLHAFKGKFLSPTLSWFLLLILLTFAIPLSGQSGAKSLHPTQDDVEAAYLYNFSKFIRWPADEKQHPLNICVLGQDPFGPALDHVVKNELVENRHLVVLRLQDTSEIQSCSILFISSSEAPRLAEEFSVLASLPVVTVSDMPDFLNQGGMIQFVVKKERVRFKVNLIAVNKCGLVLSSQLLKLAVSVIGTPAEKVTR